MSCLHAGTFPPKCDKSVLLISRQCRGSSKNRVFSYRMFTSFYEETHNCRCRCSVFSLECDCTLYTTSYFSTFGFQRCDQDVFYKSVRCKLCVIINNIHSHHKKNLNGLCFMSVFAFCKGLLATKQQLWSHHLYLCLFDALNHKV